VAEQHETGQREAGRPQDLADIAELELLHGKIAHE